MSQARKTQRADPASAERRRQLRQERRQERLKNLWRVAVFSGTAAGLGWLLLRQGWVVQSPSQVEVTGSQQVSREQVIREGQLQFPLQLLSLKPQQLRQQLSAALPVERVQVSRLMLPPRLRVELVDREAVAQAQRRGPKGLEPGYVDRLGNWMTSRQQRGSSGAKAPTVRILGWQERLRAPLAMVLARREQLGSDLQEVRFEPNGSLWLHTASLGQVLLGPPDDRLAQRLAVLEHLSRHLPAQIKGIKIESIDLSDPDQPELGLPGKAAIRLNAEPAKPQGGSPGQPKPTAARPLGRD